MDSKELRIGNWVYLDDNGGRNYQIDSGHDIDEIEGFNKDEYCFGIPLTEEWLIKFGFEVIDENTFELTIGRKVFLVNLDDLNDGTGVNQLCYKYDIQCDYMILLDYYFYIHQLQNIYFALTGEELEIK